MRPGKTHFEQISVDTVLKIAKKLRDDNFGGDIVNIQTPEEVSSPLKGWRAVAQQIQHEQDPKTMSLLVQKLLIELDEETSPKNRGIGRSGIPS